MQKLDSTYRLADLRNAMRSHNLDAFILPMEDSHFNEYIAAADKRIAFISGFTGSAGTAAIAMNKAALWTDGRYFLQAANEMDENWTLMRDGIPDNPSLVQWLIDVTPPGGRIGFDPCQLPFYLVELHARDLGQAELAKGMKKNRRSLIPLSGYNLIDVIWESFGQRPARPREPIEHVPESFSGRSLVEKVADLRESMKKAEVEAIVVATLDDIAWLLNLRGKDIPCNPVFFAYLVVTHLSVHLFVDGDRGTSSVDLHNYFKSSVEIHAYSEFFEWLSNLHSTAEFSSNSRVWFSPTANFALMNAVPVDCRHIAPSPLTSAKAQKNAAEMDGMRQSNLIDSLALCDFLAWLDAVSDTVKHEDGSLNPTACAPCDCIAEAPKTLTEATLANYVDSIRKSADGCTGLSFLTISGADENSAVIHYHVGDSENSRSITGNSMYLVDSGGQYRTGTTDVTRTVHMGTPTPNQIEDFTHVLKAHISLATLVFPSNTLGTKLDVVCRSEMWRARRDYLHGTGHGVGANLCVHEGPIGLSGRRSQILARMGITEPGILKNMVVTIEPGYYLPGKYGIRLENVNIVVPAGHACADSNTEFLGFDAITLVPFQRKLIGVDKLSSSEIAWLDSYHSTIRERLMARIESEAAGDRGVTPARKRTQAWLLRETAPLSL